MAVLMETSIGDFVIDLYTEKSPNNTKNFLKLCKAKYYNNTIFHNVIKDFIIQTGDPTGTGNGGKTVYNLIDKKANRYIPDEINKKFIPKFGSVAMASAGENKIASQFFIVTAKNKNLDSLKKYTFIGRIGEGSDIIEAINDVFLDERKRPLQNIRIRHTIVLEDPFDDPKGLTFVIPPKSPLIKYDELDQDYIPDDVDLNKNDTRTPAEKERDQQIERSTANSTLLEVLGDLPHRDINPDENSLFVCQLNPVTTDEDLRTIFSQFGDVVNCDVVRDFKTGDSLQYAFIEFEKKSQCESAFLKMNNVLLDDRRIKVDWSQSVMKQWERFNKGDRSMLHKGSVDYRPQFDSRKRGRGSDLKETRKKEKKVTFK